MPSQQMEEILQRIGIVGYDFFRYDLNKAKNKAAEIEGKLKGESPILYNEPLALEIYYDDNYYSSNFPLRYKDEEVKKIEVSFYLAISDPDAYFKPLDIVEIFNNKGGSWIVHACVYLGNKRICHALGGNRVVNEN